MTKQELPQLYATASNGKIKTWKIEVDEAKEGAYIITYHGYIDGQLTKTVKSITKGKNLGKSNSTTPYTQACSDAQSKWVKKHDKGYNENKDGGNTDQVRPMLALKYLDRGHDIAWPALIQPKLNGVRCMAHQTPSGIELLSRKGKPFSFSEHIRAELAEVFDVIDGDAGRSGQIYLDGELFKLGLPLQDIVRATRKQSGDEDRSLEAGIEYHIYDCFNLSFTRDAKPWPFAERSEYLQEIARRCPPLRHIQLVDTLKVTTPEATIIIYDRFLRHGFEGGMLRNVTSDYKMGHRSADLQKIKQFFDGEYKIIGAFEGTGTEDGCVNWTCITPEGREFNVRPRGTLEERKKLWKTHKKYIGKSLTVMYQELSNAGIPHICVGVSIRDYE